MLTLNKMHSLTVLLGLLCLNYVSPLLADELTREQKTQLRDAMKVVKKSKATSDERQKAVDQLLSLGAPGAKPLFEHAHGEIEDGIADLQRELYKAGQKAVRNNRPKSGAERRAAEERITELREQLQALAINPTKAQAASVGMPGLAELEKMLLPDTAILMDTDEKSRSAYEQIMLWQGYRSKAAGKIPDLDEVLKTSARDDLLKLKIQRIQLMTAIAAGISDNRALKVLVENEKLSKDILPQEAMGILDLNKRRMLIGYGPLAIDTKLCDASRDHCKDMAEKGFFAHDSPVPGKTKFTDRAKNFGTSASGENIAMGQSSPVATNTQWYFSPGHHKNMMNKKHRYMGLGFYQKRWCQMFR